jgi:hypothetical protein
MHDFRQWISLIEGKRQVKRTRQSTTTETPVAQPNVPQMGLAEVHTICKSIALDIEMLAQVLNDPQMKAQTAKLRKDIRTNLDRITDYWNANR